MPAVRSPGPRHNYRTKMWGSRVKALTGGAAWMPWDFFRNGYFSPKRCRLSADSKSRAQRECYGISKREAATLPALWLMQKSITLRFS